MGYVPRLPQLELAHSEDGGVRIVALTGELDLVSAGELETALAVAAGSGPSRVCLDLSTLQFIDSSGLAGVIRAHQALSAAGGTLAVVCAPGPVRRTFVTTGLLRMLTVVDDRAAAFAALGDG